LRILPSSLPELIDLIGWEKKWILNRVILTSKSVRFLDLCRDLATKRRKEWKIQESHSLGAFGWRERWTSPQETSAFTDGINHAD
jgi:hypothetical protein